MASQGWGWEWHLASPPTPKPVLSVALSLSEPVVLIVACAGGEYTSLTRVTQFPGSSTGGTVYSRRSTGTQGSPDLTF